MNFLARLLHPLTPGEDEDPALNQALERVVEKIGVNLKQSRHWPGRYRAPIGNALAQARRVAQGVPGPVTLDRENWVRNPLAHALFGSAEEMQRLMSASPTLRDFIAAHGGGEVHALLTLKREERNSFGMESAGEVLRRDVAQRLVWFTDAHFIAPAASETEARENLLWSLFDRFLERLTVGIERLRQERERLAQEKDLAQARLRGAPPARRPTLEQDMRDTIARLGETGQLLDADHLHEVFATILSHPEDCLYLEEHALRLDAMGVVHAESDGQAVATLNFVDLLERYQAPRSVVLVRCPNVTPSTMVDRLGEAGQWL
jgi:hypothetical protein